MKVQNVLFWHKITITKRICNKKVRSHAISGLHAEYCMNNPLVHVSLCSISFLSVIPKCCPRVMLRILFLPVKLLYRTLKIKQQEQDTEELSQHVTWGWRESQIRTVSAPACCTLHFNTVTTVTWFFAF